MTTDTNRKADLLTLTTGIVSAYVARNPVSQTDLPPLIASVHASLTGIEAPASVPQAAPEPAVPIRRSISDDHIVCLEDGKKFKSLKRHLMSHYGLTPEDYRAKWGLPADYPMTAPSYSQARSRLAKQSGLGRKQAA